MKVDMSLNYIKSMSKSFFYLLLNKFHGKSNKNKFKYSKFKYSKFKYSKFKYSKFKYSKFKYSKFKYSKFKYLSLCKILKIKLIAPTTFSNIYNIFNLMYMKIFRQIYVYNNKIIREINLNFKKVLLLNFKRKRFFPSLLNFQKKTYVFFSLGMISNRYGRGKNFIKKKITFFNTTSYIRKILIYTFLTNIILFIKKTPIYLLEIFNIILKPAVSLYSNPFNYSSTIEEKFYKNKFLFDKVIFLNNKSYSYMKNKQKGRLKRKIQYKILLKNRILD